MFMKEYIFILKFDVSRFFIFFLENTIGLFFPFPSLQFYLVSVKIIKVMIPQQHIIFLD